MTDLLTIKRFRALAQIYGADMDRWPADERAAAKRLARDPAGMTALSEAQSLDASLDLWPGAQVPTDLVRRTTASVTQTRHAQGLGRRLWWIGAGLAAAMSGLAAGSVAASTFLPEETYDAGATIFGDIADFEE